MSRIRTIKPESALSETLESVSVTAALLFARLPCFADDEGRMRYSPALIKAQVFPLREEVTQADCARAMEELEVMGLVCVYAVDGRKYLCIPGFVEHQKVNRPQPSQLPPPPSCEQFSEDSLNVHEQVTEYQEETGGTGETPQFTERSVNAHCRKGKEGKGRERNGKEGKGAYGEAEGDRGVPWHLQCLAAFNRICGRTESSMPPDCIECLDDLESEYSLADIEAMIRFKKRQWEGKQKMRRWIRPATLFSRQHLAEYVEESKGEEGAANGSFSEYAD